MCKRWKNVVTFFGVRTLRICDFLGVAADTCGCVIFLRAARFNVVKGIPDGGCSLRKVTRCDEYRLSVTRIDTSFEASLARQVLNLRLD